MVTLAVYHCNSVMSDLLYRRGFASPAQVEFPWKSRFGLHGWSHFNSMSKQTSWLRKSQTLNTVGESSNNVVTIVKQLINSIKKRLHTKKVITSPLFIYSSREIFCYKYRIWKIPIELYAYQNVCCSVTPTATNGRPPASSQKWKEKMENTLVLLSFFWLYSVQ